MFSQDLYISSTRLAPRQATLLTLSRSKLFSSVEGSRYSEEEITMRIMKWCIMYSLYLISLG